ncbi:MAG: hypothetical protein EA363_00520 [Balneolaceae bacterium]|nr:MAG: hypothetical protein EA363_00520 [Balneolaceae bacterium]
MDRLIRTTTEHFLAMLDDQREFYSPQELLDAGFPEFLVKRMRLELMRNLQDSVTPPQTDWADMTTDAVRKAWSQFLGAIHEEIRLPASYVAPVIESSLADILDLMVTPRAFLPEYLFGSESRLDQQMIAERCEWVVVYTYFGNALPRFMEKKGRKTLTKEQADRIIERLDERVTSHYTSLNWAQLFEPWFQLLGEKVEPGLFADFFRDKGKPGVARLFNAESDPIHRTRMIEILSKPQLDEIDDEFEDVGEDLLGVPEEVIDLAEDEALTSPKEKTNEKPAGEAKADPEKELANAQTEDAAASGQKDKNEDHVKPAVKQKTEDEVQSGKSLKSGKQDKEEDQMTTEKKPGHAVGTSTKMQDAQDEKSKEEKREKEGKKDEKDQEATSEEQEVKPDEQDVTFDDQDVTSEEKDVTSEEKDVTSEEKDETSEEKDMQGESDEDDEGNLITRYQKTNGNDKHDPPLASTLKKEPEEDEEDTIPLYSRIKSDPEEEDAGDVPIWQQFTKEEEDDAGEAGEGMGEEKLETRGETAGEDAAGEEPAGNEPVPEEELEKIRSYVKDMEDEFISELFGGDEGAFLETIEHITRLSDWKEAGSYISKEVFDRNLIDIYSDTAIYFTDRMQTYFLERE